MDTNCNNVLLSDLLIKATYGGMTGLEKFDPNKADYKADVLSDIETISITPKALEGCSITINGEAVNNNEEFSGDLKVGETKFDIVVSNGDKSNSYSLIIDREDIQPVIDKFEKTEYTDPNSGVTIKYNFFVPDDYNKNKSYPLVLFLHGAGERGDDNLSVLTSNQGATIWAKDAEQAKRPCLVLAPQCPTEKGWTSLMTSGFEDPFRVADELEAVHKLLTNITKEYNIDTKRLYCTGLSMGGFGSWALNIKYPDLFAAVVPICSYADTAAVKEIAHKPIWFITAEEDPFVKIELVRATVDALKAAGSNIIYTEYPKGTYFHPMAHFSWVPAYANEEMREWMFSQKLD